MSQSALANAAQVESQSQVGGHFVLLAQFVVARNAFLSAVIRIDALEYFHTIDVKHRAAGHDGVGNGVLIGVDADSGGGLGAHFSGM
jgi:hypothetical protein